MRIRTLALALALSCGAATIVQAAGQKTVVSKAKGVKPKKYKRQAYKRGKYPVKVKQHKAKKVKQPKR